MSKPRILLLLLALSVLLNVFLIFDAGHALRQVDRYREECGDRTDAPGNSVVPDVVQP